MKQILLSLGSAALAAALLCSCGPFQVAEKVVGRSDLEQIAEGLAKQAEDSANISEAEKAGLVRWTYTAETDVDKIKIEEHNASVRIETGNVDRVQVSYMDYADSRGYKLSQGNNALRITNDSSTAGSSGVTYTTVITLPEKEYREIEIEADNSSVVVMDVEADSVCLRNSSNTDVQLSGLAVQQIHTSLISGMVTVSDSTGYKLAVSLNTGMIQLENTDMEQYDCQVETGSIEGTILGDPDEYNIRTSVDVGSNQLPSMARKEGDRGLRFHAGTGNINVQFAG